MRIKNIGFRNFKCFKSIDLDLGKITLLTGANSSGKSSVMYGILGSLQSGEFPLQFSVNGKYVDMGNFQEISNGHRNDNLIEISYSLENGTDLDVHTLWEMEKTRKLPVLKSLVATSNLFELKIIKEKEYDFTFDFKPQLLADALDANFYLFNKDLIKKYLDFTPKSPVKFALDDLSGLNDHSLLLKGGLPLKLAIDSLKTTFVELDLKTNYISSFRLHPERTYYEQTKENLKIGAYGERYTDQIVLWEIKHPDIYQQFVQSLQEMNLLQGIKTKRMDGGRYELQVTTHQSGLSSSLADVGFGISQFLPVLVADYQLPDNSVLLISQPELHLHPGLQANFADYLVQQIKTTRKTYLVETHSEYLINRLRLAIAKGTIQEDDVRAYYFRNNGSDVENFSLNFKKDGMVENAPVDFFQTYMMDVMDIAINAAKQS